MQHFFQLLLLFSFLNSLAQSEQRIDTIGTDIFEASYVLKNNTLQKIKDEKVLEYKNFALGNIASVDILNSLEVVVFYQDYNAVVLLDKQLNEITQIQFAQTILFVNKGIVNNLWRYNDTKNQLELYDYKSRTVTNSSQVITDFVPIEMESNFNSVKLIGVDKTLIFDQYLYLTDTLIH